MIRRVLLAVLSFIVFASVGKAADLPSAAVYAKSRTVKILKTPMVQNRPKPKLTKPLQQAAVQNSVSASPEIAEPVTGQEIDLSWVLDPLVANADGGKKEDSASVEGNLVVSEPGYVTAPYMVIELNGQIVKTTDTTVRLDIQIGGKNHTSIWAADDVQAGKFKITLNAVMPEGKLPDYFPVSAIAFVTNNSRGGAAMVSLEKINIRVGKVRVAATQ